MNTREWALLIFTILTQLSVGTMLVLLIVRTYAAKKLSEEKANQLTELPFYAIVPIMVLALVASLFHLGKVLNIIGAIPNLGTSWMSREVVFAVLFMVLTAAFGFMQWRKIGTTSALMIVGWITAVVGVVLIYCMGMTYMLPVQPAWHTLATPVNFYLTTLLLGVMGTAVMLMTSYARIQGKTAEQDDFVKSTLQYIAISGIVLLGLQFLVLPLYLAFLSTQGSAAIRTLNMMFNDYGLLLAFRLLLVFVGAGVLAAYLFRKAAVSGSEKTLANLTYSAFALVILGEILARFLFYATQYRIGV
jgi:anaerobic dimethyl sulfoxide reductase subunit C (anchor subunit)